MKSVHAVRCSAFRSPARQKGASSLEYIMLAAVLVAILAVLSTSELGDKVSGFFTDIFTYATDQVPTTSDTSD